MPGKKVEQGEKALSRSSPQAALCGPGTPGRGGLKAAQEGVTVLSAAALGGCCQALVVDHHPRHVGADLNGGGEMQRGERSELRRR
ncbi:MAG TPA: hypothetical protein VNF75_07165 [Candidatus Dormibacteraeota bacterium]|nr:hypothetical protein [Candidatus Dormibacteraeota bacterium]HVD03897.1 hypothetical protein [Candidatus Dormibacteraeota bacterium]